MMQVDYFTASSLAVFLIGFVAGVLITFAFGKGGGRGCLAGIAGTIVAGMLFRGFFQGQSRVSEQLTDSLTYYIQTNFLGVVGFVGGVVLSLLFSKRGRT